MHNLLHSYRLVFGRCGVVLGSDYMDIQNSSPVNPILIFVPLFDLDIEGFIEYMDVTGLGV